MPKICIDPGHNKSGIDTGAQGCGLFEQDLTLDIGLRLKPLLEANGIEVVMTRTGEKVPGNYSSVSGSLKARCDIANNANVDLYVSIHINAGGGTGSEVWVVSTGGRAEKLAKSVLSRLVSQCGWSNRGVKTANDYVLKYTNAPAILTESGFIDTPSDARKLSDPNFRQAIAVGHAQGICDYLGITYNESRPVPVPTPVTEVNKVGTIVIYEYAVDVHSAYYMAYVTSGISIALESVTKADLDVATRIITVGGTVGQYLLNGSQIKSDKHLSGTDRVDTALQVLTYIHNGGR